MTRDARDTVLWMSLVDFLLQVVFFTVFAIVAYVVLATPKRTPTPPPPPPAYVAITDELSRLVPATLNAWAAALRPLVNYYTAAGYSDPKQWLDRQQSVVPADRAEQLFTAIENLKGIDETLKLLKRVKGLGGVGKVLGGLGRPPCLPGPDGAGYTAVGTVKVFDNEIQFVNRTEQVEALLKTLGLRYEDIQKLSPVQFRKAFGGVRDAVPGCVHYVNVEEAYTLREPRDAIEVAFVFGARRTGS